MKKFFMLSLLLAAPAFAQTQTPAAAQTTPIIPVPSVEVANIGGKSYSLEQFERNFRVVAARVLNGQGQPYSAEAAAALNPYRGEILIQYVNQQAVLQEAAQKGVTVTNAEVDAQYQPTVAQFPNEDALKGALEQSGIESADELKNIIRENLIFQKYLAQQAKRFTYPEGILRAYYNANLAKYQKPAQACVKHILVATADDASKVKARLDKGEDFAAVAQEVSADPGSKAQGGDLGCFAPGETVPEFDKAAFSGPLNTLQQVKTQFGEHLLVVTKRDTAAVTPFAQARASIEDTLAQGAANRFIGGAAQRLSAKVYAERVAKDGPAPAQPK